MFKQLFTIQLNKIFKNLRIKLFEHPSFYIQKIVFSLIKFNIIMSINNHFIE